MAHVHVQVDSNGQHVEVDGKDVGADVRALRIDVEGGRPAEVTVWPVPGHADFDGEAFVRVAQDGDAYDGAVTFLKAVDPEAFEKRCLEQGGYSESTPRVALRLLLEAALQKTVP